MTRPDFGHLIIFFFITSSDEDESDLEGEPGDAAPAALGKAVASAPASNTQAIPALPTPGNIEVRQYDPKTANPQQKKKFAETEEYLVSPITGNTALIHVLCL